MASLRYLERALASERRPLTPAMREETGRLLEANRGLVTHLHLAVEPRHAKATLDGEAIEPVANGRIPVAVGAHELIVRAPDYLTQRLALDVKSGAETRVDVSLVPDNGGVVEVDDDPVYEQWWFWTAAGVVAIGAVVTAVAISGDDARAANGSPDGAVTWMALRTSAGR